MKINKQKFISAELVQEKWMKNPEYRREYDALEPEFQIARQMMDARIKRKMSQETLAKKIGTGQAVISRLEGMNSAPSLTLLKKVSKALGIKFELSI